MDRVIDGVVRRRKSLGMAIRQLRKQRELTLKELASATGFSSPKLCRIELGKERVRLEDVDAIARALRQDVKFLLTPAPRPKEKSGLRKRPKGATR
jgi:transcriptional regulator with XRE-family HTH domain